MSSERSLRPLADRLLTIIEEAIPAEDTAVLLQQSGEDSFLEFRGPKKRDETVAQLPRGILRRVVKERISVSINEVQGTDVEDLSKSVVALKLNSILAVPLITRGRVIGVIYAAAREMSVRFDEDHLQLLTGIAGLAAGGLENMLHLETLKDENRELQARINAPQDLVGDSPCIANVHKFITRVAPTPTTVLITGESGTGKELVARAIHRNSPRHPKPFVAINCATLTETLLESELFGHEKGAFTGAIAQKRGKLETAEGGTVFLDEIGEMPLTLQAKLLRVLQEREFERLGGTRPIKVDIRLIAATNRNLAEMAKTGGFREDLYYRLNVVSITTPPLRQHREDIPVLARYFVEKHEHIAARRVTGISAEALDYLMRYDWPGNVRELQNVIERALVMGSTEYLLPDDLPESVLEVGSSGPATVDFHEQVNESKRRIILSALEQFGGNYTEAAKQLGIHPNNLHRLIRNLNLKAALKK
jgi:transcriptional regulator with GAF, ATPase, and Fis domain